MSDTAIPKAIIIAGAMIAISATASHHGAGGFIWTLLAVGGGGYLAWREFWNGEMPNLKRDEDDTEDPVADRFR